MVFLIAAAIALSTVNEHKKLLTKKKKKKKRISIT